MSMYIVFLLLKEKKLNYIQTELFMSQARPENFRSYRVVAENNVGAAYKYVELFRSKFTSLYRYTDIQIYIYTYIHIYVTVDHGQRGLE
jgi:hypothetical protein